MRENKCIPTRYTQLLVLLFIIIATVCCFFALNQQMWAGNKEHASDLRPNERSYGIYDLNSGKLCEANEPIIPIDNKVNVQLNYMQNKSESGSYLLSVFVNCVQRPFNVEGNTYEHYTFEVDAQCEVNVNIELEVDENTDHEILFLLFNEPAYRNANIESESDVYYLKNISIYPPTMRYPLYNDLHDAPEINILNDIQPIELPVEYNGIFLSKEHDDLTLLPVVGSGEKVYLTIFNIFEYERDFAIISLLDWQQYPISNTDIVKYVNVPSRSAVICEIIIPTVDTETPYQIVALPCPYMPVDDLGFVYKNYAVYACSRTIVTS